MGYGLTTARNTIEAGEIGDSNRFIDLKLGSFGQSEVQSFDNWDYCSVPRMELPSSSKRARAPNIGTQVASCLVDGCNSDLSKCRDYHRRHKVCELHSKTPTVTIRGQEQRFCQQCSRFHSLVEFDDDKRSCRKRLDGHNRRRRKPQPDTLSLTAGRFLSTFQGARSTPFGSSSMFTVSSLGDCPWLGSVKAENGTVHYSSHHQLLNFNDRNVSSFPGSALHDLTIQTQFSPAIGVSNAGLMSAQSSPVSTRQSASTDVNRVVASGRALSLLSSSSAETPEKGLSHMMQPDPATPTQSWNSPGLQYQRTADEKPVTAMLGLECTNDGGIFHCQGLFEAEHGVISSSAPSAATSFSWD